MSDRYPSPSASQGEAHSAARGGGDDLPVRSDDPGESTRGEQRHEQLSPRLKRPLTGRERAIVEAVGRHRVLTGAMIQRWFFPIGEGASRMGALRRSQRCCRRLVDERLLDTLDRRIGGERSGSSGYCYTLGTLGQRLLRPDARARRSPSLGLAYVDHSLATAELEVGLIEAQSACDLDRYQLDVEAEAWRVFLDRMGQRVIVKPDAFVSVVIGETERRTLVEVDRNTASLVRVTNKCRLYLQYLASGEEQRRYGVFPKVLWTVPTPKRRQQIRDVVSGLPPPAARLFEICLQENAITHLKGGES